MNTNESAVTEFVHCSVPAPLTVRVAEVSAGEVDEPVDVVKVDVPLPLYWYVPAAAGTGPLLTGVVTLVVVVCLVTAAGAVVGVVVAGALVVDVPIEDWVAAAEPPVPAPVLPPPVVDPAAAAALLVAAPLEPAEPVDLLGALKAMGLAVLPDEQAATPVANPSAKAAMASLCAAPRREPI